MSLIFFILFLETSIESLIEYSRTNERIKMIAYKLKEIMVNFLQRDFGFSESEARQELEFLFSNSLPVTRDYYRTVSRVGATVALNRKLRDDIWESLENAKNHASFDSFIVAA